MKIVFIHQNMPGQFKHLASRFGQSPDNQVVFITRRNDVNIPGVRRVNYNLSREPNPKIHSYLIRTESAVLYGQGVARAMMDMKKEGFVPDLIVAHSGWGESLFTKDIYPKVPLLNYCEFYYRAYDSDMDFDGPPAIDSVCRSRIRNSHLLLSLEECDHGWSPTQWQKSVHPRIFHPKISVVHEGIDINVLKPDPEVTFPLADGRVLTRNDPVVTYVARNLEPYRGFPSFMRAIPHILEARPDATILIVGGDEISYGNGPPGGGTWREKMLAEVPVDPTRVHFLGRIPYPQFIRMLQLSSVHVYLTYPFVLSWSTLEAMSCGAVVVGSRTHPVEEVITDGQNGYLVDFFKPEEIAARVVDVLRDRPAHAGISEAARRTVLRKYDLAKCFKAQMDMLTAVARGRR